MTKNEIETSNNCPKKCVCKWNATHLEQFIDTECKVLHMEGGTQMHSFKIGDTCLSKTTSAKDLGIGVDHKPDTV